MWRMLFLGVAVAVALVAGPARAAPVAAPVATLAAASVEGPERVMVADVAARAAADVALLERLVNVNSGTLNPAGVAAVAAMLVPEFRALGFETKLVPMDEVARGPHLFARHEGTGKGRRMLLIAHLDTVFEPDSPFQQFRRDGDRATGPGVIDAKGGIVVILSALRAMEAAGVLGDATIEVALTGDEEEAGVPRRVSRAALVAAGRRADVALDFEPLSRAGGQDMGSIARRSSNSWALETRGRAGHSSGIFSQQSGDGAIFELARIIAAFRTELPEPSLTFNVGLVAGGTTAAVAAEGSRAAASGKTNIIPEVALAEGDFRTLSPEQTERVKARMQAIVARHLPGTSATIRFREPYPPMAPTKGNRALLAMLNGVNRDLGLPAMPELDPLRRGAGDIGFVAADVDGLVGLGPAGSGSHSDREDIDLPSLTLQATRAALLMHRLAGAPGGR